MILASTDWETPSWNRVKMGFAQGTSWAMFCCLFLFVIAYRNISAGIVHFWNVYNGGSLYATILPVNTLYVLQVLHILQFLQLIIGEDRNWNMQAKSRRLGKVSTKTLCQNERSIKYRSLKAKWGGIYRVARKAIIMLSKQGITLLFFSRYLFPCSHVGGCCKISSFR